MGERTASRVVVTGIGVLSGFGAGLAAFEAGLFSGRSAIRRIEGFDTAGLACRFGAEIPGFDWQGLVRRSELHFYDRVGLLAMAAADEALGHAGLGPDEIGPAAGAMMGTAFGPAEAIEDCVLRAASHQRLRPTAVVRMMLNGATAALCARYRLQRAATAHVTACAASAHAIADAVHAIRRGEMDLCLAGGAEAFPTSALFAAWDALAIMSPEIDPAAGIMRPFSPDRTGFVIGEAAAVLVLEREERARSRGAPILGEICGVGAVSDAASLTKPTLPGMTRAMRAAIADAGIAPEDIGHVNAHGTATELNDALESQAIRELFGARADDIRVSACKAAIGHCMGAGSAVEAVAAILALRRQEAPCPVDLLPPDGVPAPPGAAGGEPVRRMETAAALSNSFAFGGHYAALAVRRVPDAVPAP
ncbi:beta-ketoacyl-[acyl-carrier-protein] synthase family protein [Aurantimonas sp. 22II-16-19i]|uniref:beta-ketoacyl-[acyl-carrier-protein] synthase family protein n=1 Tax=Aurantimonas sp. 22II-16-19i TaxID=1317114 RepID=UPI0009F7A829|nr:beta-ketoacyl-[acyl-carrier-protein] synthase family protein [Aurantimonas sp. 22II-16-19i]ORE92724.1 Beta-ketoacyl synthase [Aurantimonas sp. 22II-16-19i]